MSDRRGGIRKPLTQDTLQGLAEIAKEHQSFITKGSKDWPKLVEAQRQADALRNASEQFLGARLSHLTIQTGETQLVLGNKSSEDGKPETVNVLLLHPERVHVTSRLRDHLTTTIPKVIEDAFRIEPGYQDYSARELRDPVSWVVYVTGLKNDPQARRRLMRAGALINGSLEAEGFLVKG